MAWVDSATRYTAGVNHYGSSRIYEFVLYSIEKATELGLNTYNVNENITNSSILGVPKIEYPIGDEVMDYNDIDPYIVNVDQGEVNLNMCQLMACWLGKYAVYYQPYFNTLVFSFRDIRSDFSVNSFNYYFIMSEVINSCDYDLFRNNYYNELYKVYSGGISDPVDDTVSSDIIFVLDIDDNVTKRFTYVDRTHRYAVNSIYIFLKNVYPTTVWYHDFTIINFKQKMISVLTTIFNNFLKSNVYFKSYTAKKLATVINHLKPIDTKTYTNSTWNTSKTWYIKVTYSPNTTSNVVNYETSMLR